MESFSKRILEFSKSKDFVGNTGEFSFVVKSAELNSRFFVSLNRENIGSISYESELDGPFLGIFHSLCKLFSNSSLDRVRTFAPRELESFLRDSNQTPSVPGDQFPTQFIEDFKKVLLSSYLAFFAEEDISGWCARENATYVGNIKAIKEFFTLRLNMMNYFSEQNIEVNLVHLAGKEVVIEFISTVNSLKLAPTSLSNEEFSVLAKIIGTIIGHDQINLVAE
ncbi:hypothetical protein A9Q84_06915 [Halobacteriovorax marinus]|uniref:Uncharacterized protein n=1 Tax=Halobacteriovorax marinus TaxID=97084 RepID=A0A1Y5F9P4_9BACT|nr:hypothetical protein A9Q84_06915 [Halobacteriovorax marinus]